MISKFPAIAEPSPKRETRRLAALSLLAALTIVVSPLTQADGQGNAASPDHLLNTWHAVEVGNADEDTLRPKEKNWETYVFADDGTFSLATESQFMGEMDFEGEWTFDPAASELRISVPGVVDNATFEVRELTQSRLLLVDRARNKATLYSLTPPAQREEG